MTNKFQISNFKFEIILVLLVISYFLYFSFLSIVKHRNFYTNYYDLAIMDQTVYNTSRGRILELTNPEGTNNFRRMAIHNDIILAFLAPFYLIYSNPETLLVIQTLVISLGAIPLYLLAKKYLKSRPVALIIAFCYLIYPPLQWSNLFDFHGVVLASSFILFMVYYSLERKYLAGFLFFLLAVFSKEQVALSTGLFGLIQWFSSIRKNDTKSRNYYFFMGLFSFIWIMASFLVIIPYFRGTGHFALSRYPDGYQEILTLKDRLFSENTFRYFQQILSPMGHLPLLSPLYFLMIIPELGINLFSNHQAMRGIYHHYTAVLTPFLFISTVFALRKFNKFIPIVALLILASSLNSFYRLSPTHLSKDNYVKKISVPRFKNSGQIKLWQEALKDENITISATEILGSHFSQRKKIFRFSASYSLADYVLIYTPDVYNDWIDKKKAIENYGKLISDGNFRLVMKKEEFEVYKKITNPQITNDN